jgi:hypothetical protein
MPNFFDEADASGIVEDHIKKVLSLEASESDKILSSYSEVRDQLIQKLSRFPPGSFTAQHLRGVLSQVQGAIEAMNSGMKDSLSHSAYDFASAGMQDNIDEINMFDEMFTGAVTPINLNAALAAREVSNLLTTKYETNLEAYGNDLQTQITNGLFSAALGEVNHEEVVGRISSFFTAEEWKLRRIVRTELHNIYNVGKLRSMGDLSEGQIPDLMKTLMHPMDDRTGDDSKYAARVNLVAAIDEPFQYTWRGKPREFMAPPDRPNDRAILVPYRREWGTARGGAFLPGSYPEA